MTQRNGPTIIGQREPERIPLDMLLDRICNDLFMVFVGNGYKHIGFTLIAHATDSGEGGASGNLKPEGVKALLEGCLEQMNKVEVPPGAADEPKH